MADMLTEDLIDQVATLQERNRHLEQQIRDQRETIDALEKIIHKAARIATAIPGIARAGEMSVDVELAATQLQTLLVRRTVE